MTYSEFQYTCAFHGFSSCPLSPADFDQCRDAGMLPDAIYGAACDVAAGFSLEEAITANGSISQ